MMKRIGLAVILVALLCGSASAGPLAGTMWVNDQGRTYAFYRLGVWFGFEDEEPEYWTRQMNYVGVPKMFVAWRFANLPTAWVVVVGTYSVRRGVLWRWVMGNLMGRMAYFPSHPVGLAKWTLLGEGFGEVDPEDEEDGS